MLEVFENRFELVELRTSRLFASLRENYDANVGAFGATERIRTRFVELLFCQLDEIRNLRFLWRRVSKLAHELGQLVDIHFAVVLFGNIVLRVRQSQNGWKSSDCELLHQALLSLLDFAKRESLEVLLR